MNTLRPLQAVSRALFAQASVAGVAVFSATFLGTLTSPAAPEQEPIRLEYVADPGCPSAEDFKRMVFQRTHSARPAHPEEVARLFTVTLQREQHWVRGSLTVREGEQSLVRQVNGRECTELASVLALATALAIDPSAELLPPSDTTTAPAAAASAPPSVPAASSTPAPAAPPAGAEPLPYDPPDALPSDTSETVVEFGLGPRVEWAATPYAALGPSIAVEWGAEEATWRFAIGASALFTAAKEVATARADFRILTASLSACRLAIRWQSVQLGPCLQADLGDLYATASDIPFRQSTHRFWSTLGVHLELLVELADGWNLGLDAGPHLVLTRYRFQFNEPDTDVFDQGSWAGSARLRLKHRF